MKPAIGLGIGHQPVSLLILLAGAPQEAIRVLGKPVPVDKIISRVVGRVDVDHLHLAEVGLLEELQGIQVVPFDEEVPRGIESYALLPAGPEGLGDGGVGGRAARLPGQSRR